MEDSESNFIFEDNEYICKPVKSIKFVNDIASEGIRVSSLEKTIIDCIDNIDLAGGIEEVLNALEQIKYINENKLLEILKIINCQLQMIYKKLLIDNYLKEKLISWIGLF